MNSPAGSFQRKIMHPGAGQEEGIRQDSDCGVNRLQSQGLSSTSNKAVASELADAGRTTRETDSKVAVNMLGSREYSS